MCRTTICVAIVKELETQDEELRYAQEIII